MVISGLHALYLQPINKCMQFHVDEKNKVLAQSLPDLKEGRGSFAGNFDNERYIYIAGGCVQTVKD